MKIKQIIIYSFILSLIPISSFAEPLCNKDKYAVVYINGMLNSKIDAEAGMKALKNKLIFSGVPIGPNENTRITLAFNPSHIGGAGDIVKVLLQKSLDISKEIAGLDYDAKEMLLTLHNEVKEGRILFVPHSQGNFYANTMHSWIVTQKDGLSHESINMYNVASPTQFGAVNSKYILSKSDKVISGMVGMVGAIAPPNVNFDITKESKDPLGHNFIDVYLALGGNKMISDIKSELKILKPDENKDEYTACIPSPETGLLHDVEGLLYKAIDPVAKTFVDSTKGLIAESVKSYSTIASVFGINKKIADETPSNIQPIVENTPPIINIDDNNTLIKTENSESDKLETGLILKKDPKINDELSDSSLLEPKTQAEENNSQKIVISGISGPSNTIYTPPKISETGNPSTSTPEFSSSTNPEATSTVPKPPNSTSTGPVVPPNSTSSELILGVNIIPYGEVREVLHDYFLEPKVSDLMISEYYIGKEGEATWVEVFNRSGYWINTKNIEFADGDNNVKFPVTGMPAHSSIILRSNGKVIHKASDTLMVANSLQERTRDTGSFSLIYKNENNISTLDKALYGGDYCKSKYSYSRSCERMVDFFPGDKEEYWVRSRIIEDIYHDYESLDPKYWTSIGKENPSWKYYIYEGNVVQAPELNNNNAKDRRVYVSGYISIPKDTVKILGTNPNIFLIRSESGIFENINDTQVDVYGTLHVPSSGLLRSFEKGDIKIIIRDSGKVIEDIFGTIDVPTIIDGGLMRANIRNSKITLNSGKLYLSYSKFDNKRVVAESCNYYKESYSGSYYGVEWNGGNLYKDGYDCKNRDEIIPDNYVGEFDIFGVIDRREPLTCQYHILDSGEAECNEITPATLKTEVKSIQEPKLAPVDDTVLDENVNEGQTKGSDDIQPTETIPNTIINTEGSE